MVCIYVYLVNQFLCSVQQLLQEGVDPGSVDNRQRSPLHIAAARGDEQTGMCQLPIKTCLFTLS